MSTAAARRSLLADLIAASHLITLEQLPGLVAEHAARAGWPDVLIYLADLQQDMLHLLTERGPDSGYGPPRQDDRDRPSELRVDGTLAGRAFQLGTVVPACATGGDQWWVPLVNGTERMGVLRIEAPDDPALMADLRNLAGLIGLMLVSKRGTSDSYSRLVRRREMNVAAEMEWRLMPPRTFATDRVLISAVMEPAYEVSGDVFDYGVAGDTVHLGVFDAMGHDTAAGLTANLALAACRNHRRQHSGMLRTAAAVEEALAAQFDGSRFATGVLADLDLTTGVLSWTSCGHPAPVIIRGGRTALSLDCPPGPPLGTGLGLSPSLCHDQLEPGDRLLLHTDGITEARNPEGEEFGLARFTDFLIRRHSDGLPLPETLRRLIRHHLDYHHGRLNDDATVLLVEWHGPTPYHRSQVEALVGLPGHTAPPVLQDMWTADARDRGREPGPSA
ncbi:PP2C family protein-serine/threonine phosphatase [Streptomyces sclerotialus]|uniref:PP2C family protein-serine/threonine phosphatase n=1 Tax=Streptomyces sclerotialus TaxID=1957 RepID=UPI00099BA5AD